MTFIGGIGAQAGRNAILEPFRTNVRSADPVTRRGELTADALFIGGGATAGVIGVSRALSAGGAVGRIGAALVGGVGVLAAAVGIANLYAKLPSTPDHDPKPVPSPGPDPKPVPSPSPDPVPSPGPDPKPGPKPGPTPDPAPKPAPGPAPKPVPGPPSTGPVQTPPPAEQPTPHVVRPGENLSFIADCYDRDWHDIYTFNQDAIGADPDGLAIGMTLQIPPSNYHGGQFTYAPTAVPGILPDGLVCAPDSPKAKAADCPPS